MIQVEMNDDVRKYKETLIGPFSMRECLCIAGGLGLTWFIKSFAFPDTALASDVTGFIAICCLAPFIVFGWVKIYGMYMEDFIRYALSTIMSPTVRKFDTELKKSRVSVKTKKSKDRDLKPFK